MKGNPLSELIAIEEDLKQGCLNVIETGCGAGKEPLLTSTDNNE